MSGATTYDPWSRGLACGGIPRAFDLGRRAVISGDVEDREDSDGEDCEREHDANQEGFKWFVCVHVIGSLSLVHLDR